MVSSKELDQGRKRGNLAQHQRDDPLQQIDLGALDRGMNIGNILLDLVTKLGDVLLDLTSQLGDVLLDLAP